MDPGKKDGKKRTIIRSLAGRYQSVAGFEEVYHYGSEGSNVPWCNPQSVVGLYFEVDNRDRPAKVTCDACVYILQLPDVTGTKGKSRYAPDRT